MEYFSANPSLTDNISRVQAQIGSFDLYTTVCCLTVAVFLLVDSVKDVMVENIERVLERGEKIELLVDKTERLNQQAFKFEKTVKCGGDATKFYISDPLYVCVSLHFCFCVAVSQSQEYYVLPQSTEIHPRVRHHCGENNRHFPFCSFRLMHHYMFANSS